VKAEAFSRLSEGDNEAAAERPTPKRGVALEKSGS
jgi:hypothetical protein